MILDGVRRNKRRVLIGRDARAADWLARTARRLSGTRRAANAAHEAHRGETRTARGAARRQARMMQCAARESQSVMRNHEESHAFKEKRP